MSCYNRGSYICLTRIMFLKLSREKFFGWWRWRRFHNGIFFQRDWCWLCCLIKSCIGRIKIFLLEFLSKKFFGWWRWPLEGHYYKKFDPVCCVCTTPLNPEETKLFKNRKKEYSSVIPCCQNESCIKKNIKFESGKYSGWICKRKRGSLLNQKEEKKKRKAQHDIAQERINKRRKKVPIPKD